MLRQSTYDYLRQILRDRPRRPVSYAHHTFGGGFVPQHRSCHLTAMQVAVELGLEPILGIQLLLFKGALSPWAHALNRSPAFGLTDYSPPVLDVKLGFVVLDWNEFSRWRDVLADYHSMREPADGLFGDALADQLSAEFLPIFIVE